MTTALMAVDAGIQIDGAVVITQILNGIADPSVAPGLAAPVSSQYTRATDAGNGKSTIQVYDKFGTADTDWAARSGATTSTGESTSVIGTPSDGTYTDGLFGFTPATKVGDAVDDINEFLSLMAPPNAPPLSILSGGTVGASGKLSYDTTHTIDGYTYDATAINTLVSNTGTSLGVFNGATGITATLNGTIAAHSAGSYVAGAFANGDTGTLELWVNGVVVKSVDLAVVGSGAQLTAGSGFALSAATACKFSNGNDFATLKYRTGTLVVAPAAQRAGYNVIQVKHVTTSGIASSNIYTWHNSINTTAMSVSGTSLVVTPSTTRKLSGVTYYTAATMSLSATLAQAYKDVYSPLANAVSYSSTQGAFASVAIPSTTINTADITLTPSASIFTTLRLLNATAGASIVALHPVKATLNSAMISSGTVLFDPIVTEAALVEQFNTETYRVSTVPATALAVPTVYDSAENVVSTNSLQVVGGLLKYPYGDWRSLTEAGVIEYAPSGNPTYVGSTGVKTYIRAFKNTSGATRSNFKINIAGATTTFAPVGALTGNQVSVEMKFPDGSLNNGTGFMDAFADYATGQWTDGKGCRSGSLGLGRALATDWGMTIGTRTIAINEYVYVRISAPASWTGNLDSITFTWL